MEKVKPFKVRNVQIWSEYNDAGRLLEYGSRGIDLNLSDYERGC